MKLLRSAFVFSAVLAAQLVAFAVGTHPRLLLTPAEVKDIRASLGHAPLFDRAYAEAKERVERALAAPILVPQPKDAAGFTHERHKANYAEMQLAGFLYQITGEARYAAFVKAMLEKYAVLYPTLGNHPAAASSSPGRLFHQSLNECVWLVHTSQAYDCIYDTLTTDERKNFETHIFEPMAHFLADERAHEFDRIHNHGTWAATAVGMAGYVMGDDELVKKALYGSKMDGKTGGWFKQLDELYAPDGYYCEGPYYARYVIMPFYVFAQVIENNQPELKVFARRDSVLRKAVDSLLQLTYLNGEFIPFNDAMKEKTFQSPEIPLAVDWAYIHYGRDPHLLDIAKRQGSVALNAAGLAVAQALVATPQPPAFKYRSVAYGDGPHGADGGVGVLRASSGNSQSLALLKYSAFGMEHGHYDKLSVIYYDQGREILSDYGSARWVNVEQKWGGRYLKENKSYAKQTVAHNALVVDRTTQYGGDYDAAELQHSDAHFFDVSNASFQIVSARDTTAVKGVAMQRTIAMVRDPKLPFPVLVDVLRSTSATEHDYDLPFYYQGHFLSTNVPVKIATTERKPLGKSHGYEHLWLEGEGVATGPVQFTWINGSRYYTVTSSADAKTQLVLTRIGANDPNFNLRNEAAFMLRTRAANHVFASVLEPHGVWDGTKEFTTGGFPTVQSVRVVASTDEGTVVAITGKDGLAWTLMITNRAADAQAEHRIDADGQTYMWTGNAALRRD
ncbi:MAG: heparinase II/III family protein [Candidatus Didemnitutus sp.]|nr:heparinase II/III family protein [Candidatus Didemnitutus sp.]